MDGPTNGQGRLLRTPQVNPGSKKQSKFELFRQKIFIKRMKRIQVYNEPWVPNFPKAIVTISHQNYPVNAIVDKNYNKENYDRT